ncbi:helix-turn-helix domain-containing protein [Chryseobacterium bernardetii]|uniref:helix-turn-helix domain-containing protein n=1 Tax=Chryseobacterium bernardetii TaxID=1241978 RepID=UPI00162459B1|nr:helix-turn-helix domain-containing protein [Chryseobacterium bernardetii]
MNKIDIKEFKKKHGLTTSEVADIANVSVRAVQSWEYNQRNISSSAFKLLVDYEQNVFSKSKKDHESEVMQKLKEVTAKKKKSKTSEGRLIDESELVPVEQFIIPIPGQAGLKKAFFAPDQYIEDHFEKEVIYVKPSERAVYHKIEVAGNSMPGILEPGEWARCEDIPQMYWENRDTFKPNKVYCLFHRKHGILFKRVSTPYYGSITLSSDNPDKVEYPDETFDLMEFSKILIVRKKEVDL